jgi:hypothetical protein
VLLLGVKNRLIYMLLLAELVRGVALLGETTEKVV